MRRQKTIKHRLMRILSLWIPLLLFAMWTVLPVYWMFRTSLMSDQSSQQVPLQYIPWPITLRSYVFAWRGVDLGRLFANSLFVATISSILGLLLALLSAYALARFRFRLKVAVMLGLAGTQMIPIALVIVPYFVLFTRLRLVNTLYGLVFAYALGRVPFSVLMLKQFYEQIPVDLDEAAMVDGCSRLGALLRVVMPLTLPGMVAVTIFNFINDWNEMMLATVLINSPKLMTLPVGLATLKDEFVFSWGTHAAGAMIGIIPSFIMFTLIQRYLITGLASGSVKG